MLLAAVVVSVAAVLIVVVAAAVVLLLVVVIVVVDIVVVVIFNFLTSEFGKNRPLLFFQSHAKNENWFKFSAFFVFQRKGKESERNSVRGGL